MRPSSVAMFQRLMLCESLRLLLCFLKCASALVGLREMSKGEMRNQNEQGRNAQREMSKGELRNAK